MAPKKEKDKGFLLRIDPATMEAVERWAADEFRSVNGQLQWIINDALIRYKRRRRTKGSDSQAKDSDNKQVRRKNDRDNRAEGTDNRTVPDNNVPTKGDD